MTSKNQMDIADFLKDIHLDPSVTSHLAKVYATLGYALLCSVGGAATHLYTSAGGYVTFIIAIVLMVALASDKTKTASPKRFGLMGLFGYLIGISLGPLLKQAIDLDPSIVVTSFLGTTVVFVCFSISAILSTRRKFLQYGGMLSSMFCFTGILGFLNAFVAESNLTIINLYLGLFVFCAYVLVDTQMIIEKVHKGSKDYIWHAVELFVDFIGIFTRILTILIDDKDKKSKENKNE